MWLLRKEVARRLEQASQLQPSAEQRREFEERNQPSAEAPRNFSVTGKIAQIKVEGILTPKPDFFAMLFGLGNTTYESIQTSVALAESDPSVSEIQFLINSPGGTVAGLFETLAVIDSAKKPKRVLATMADSAAYSIAAVAGKIEAVTSASEFGSVGVVATYFQDDALVDITSTDAPNKRPDVATDEGKAVIREELDEIHDLFVETIATGRTNAGHETTKDDVNQDFGRGSVLLAKSAKKRGMIDRIRPSGLRAVSPRGSRAESAQAEPIPNNSQAVSGNNQRKSTMDEQELKDKHPEIFAAVTSKARAEGLEQGKTEGQTAERKRVNAHLTLGKTTGANDIAAAAIASGVSVLDEEVHAQYMSASMNRRDSADRQDDSDAAGATTGNAEVKPEAEEDMGDRVVALMKARKKGIV